MNFYTYIPAVVGSIIPALLMWFKNKQKQKTKLNELSQQQSYIKAKLRELDLTNHPTIREEARQYIVSIVDLEDEQTTSPNNIQIETIESLLKDGKQLLENLKTVENSLSEPSIDGDATIYQIQLKLKAPKEIYSHFDKYPCDLKSKYILDVSILDNDEFRSRFQTQVHRFKREDFTFQNKKIKNTDFDLMSLSKVNHCTLELRPPEELIQTKSTIESTQIIQSHPKKWHLYLVAHGKSGVQLKRENQISNILKGQEMEIIERDEIILLPQLSYVVTHFYMKQQQNNY